MLQPPLEQLVTRTGGRYAAAAIVAARARQLITGDLPAVDTAALSPVTVAMEELATGRLRAEPRGSPHARTQGRSPHDETFAEETSAGVDAGLDSSDRLPAAALA
jgi:DNA-directed RNA polymerase subunit omega